MAQFIKAGIILYSIFLLAGCAHPYYGIPYGDSTTQYGISEAFQYDTYLTEDLAEQGVHVIQLGERLRLILPTDRFFMPQKATLNPDQTQTLNLISALVRQYDNGNIIITGHTDEVGSFVAKLNLSYQQAHAIASYLWANGIPLEHMNIIGCADKEPVSSNKTVGGSAANRRVEITIE